MKNQLLPASDSAAGSADLNDPPGDDPEIVDGVEVELDLDPPCVMVFNASDPSGAGGLNGDALAIASVGAGVIRDQTSQYSIAWFTGAALCVVAAALSLGIRRRRPRPAPLAR